MIACLDRDFKPPQGPMCSYGLITEQTFGDSIILTNIRNYYNEEMNDMKISDRYKREQLFTIYTQDFRLYDHQYYRGELKSIDIFVR